MQSSSWEELVAQVKQGARPEEALGLREPQENLSTEEFWQRLVVKGVGDTPLSFLPPDPAELLEGTAVPSREDLVVLPPCLCLDAVLQPEFVLPPASGEQGKRRAVPTSPAPPVTEKTVGIRASGPAAHIQSSAGLGKRRREASPEPPSPQSITDMSSPEVISDSDVIDLTQD